MTAPYPAHRAFVCAPCGAFWPEGADYPSRSGVPTVRRVGHPEPITAAGAEPALVPLVTQDASSFTAPRMLLWVCAACVWRHRANLARQRARVRDDLADALGLDDRQRLALRGARLARQRRMEEALNRHQGIEP